MCSDPLIRLDDERRVAGRDVRPALLDELAKVDPFELPRFLSLFRERKQIRDQLKRPIDGAGGGDEVVALAVVAGERKPPLRDVERVSEIV